MKLYKLTDQNNQTYNGKTQWGENIINKLSITDNPKLCTKDVIHAYKNINLAFLLNPVHGGYKNPKVWEAKGKVVVEDWGKVGCFELTTIKEIALPNWIGSKYEHKVRIQFVVLCATAYGTYGAYKAARAAAHAAATRAVSYTDRAAAHAAACAARAAYIAAAYAVSYTDRAAAHAAAADAAYAAYAAAARAVSDTDRATARAAARASAYATDRAATQARIKIDFVQLADEAVELIEEKL